MINFMLANLYHPSWQFLALFLPVEVIILYFHFLVSSRLMNTVQGQTASSVSYISRFETITGLNITTSINPIFTMIIFFFTPITSCYALSRSSRQISMQACLLGSLLPRIFAAIPTHRSRFACNVSRRSFPTWISAFVAGSDGWPKKKMSLTICFTIYVLNVQNTS